MMFADMLIEFVYLIMRILYNIVKYSAISIIKLVKYFKRQYMRKQTRRKFNIKCTDIKKDENGKYIIEFKGGPKI